jgi:hypothetical protein
VLSRVHWVRPELLAQVTYLEWIDDGLLRQVVYEGLREDKSAAKVRRNRPAGAVKQEPPTRVNWRPGTPENFTTHKIEPCWWPSPRAFETRLMHCGREAKEYFAVSAMLARPARADSHEGSGVNSQKVPSGGFR